MSLRILTFNWHESYIHLLAKTGYDFDVVEKEKAGIRGWIRAIRPVPANCRLVTESEARAKLNAGTYDRIIAHNVGDLLFVQEVETPKVLVFHNKLSTEIALGKDPVDKSEYLERVSRLFAETRNLSLVFISHEKMQDWGFLGEIILPGVDSDDYGTYSGEEERVLRVGNGLRERDVMLGYSVQERVTRGLPSTILGLNPLIPHAYVPKDWDEYRAFLRGHRVYLNTTLEPYEDGYNLAMLEAMATGMPVVSTDNSTSPIEDGVSGYLSKDEAVLRARLETLLKDRRLASSIGKRARERVLDRFPIRKFLDRWGLVLEAKTFHQARGARAGTPGRRSEILLVPDTAQAISTEPINGGQRRNMPSVSQKEAEADSTPLHDYYKKERSEVAVLIPEEAERILDIGCGGGHLGRLLKSQAEGREIWGVEIHPDACREARKWLDHVSLADACEWDPPVEEGYFDVLVFADVLEHLLDAKATLEHYLRWLKPTGSVVMSIPNVRFWELVQHLVDGYWTYGDEGLLDRGHVRFFTWAEIKRLLASCGLECGEVRSNLDRRCPDVAAGRTIDLRLGRITLHDLERDELREFFTVQYLVRGVRTRQHLLSEAERLEVEGRGREAFRLYANLLARDGVDTKAAGRLAEIGTTVEEKRKASALIDECLCVHPANIELLLASARLLVEGKRLEEARQRLERVLLFEPEHGEARARLDGLSCC